MNYHGLMWGIFLMHQMAASIFSCDAERGIETIVVKLVCVCMRVCVRAWVGVYVCDAKHMYKQTHGGKGLLCTILGKSVDLGEVVLYHFWCQYHEGL